MSHSQIKSLSNNIYVAILLSVLTLGIYSIFWLHMQANFFNSQSKQEKIPMVLVYICYGLLIVTFFRSVAHVFFPLYFAFKLLLLFAIRREFHQYYLISERSSRWLSAVYTVLFGFLYFIYKMYYFPKQTVKN